VNKPVWVTVLEAPKEIEVHFVESEVNPTGMGEPPFPSKFGAVANAMYKGLQM
jgi:isoquinoline 1-oxidoreductase beta subunit